MAILSAVAAVHLAAQPAAAGEAQRFLGMYERAMVANPAVAGAQARADGAKAGAVNAAFGMLPRASGSFDNDKERQRVVRTDNPVYQAGDASFMNHRRGIDVIQPVVDFRMFARFEAARAASHRVGYELSRAQQKLISSLIEAYIMAVAAEDSRRLSAAEAKSLDEHASIVRQRMAAGLANDADLSQVLARRDQARADVVTATSAVRQAFAAIRRLTGEAVGGIYRLKSNYPIGKPQPLAAEPWLELANNNPELLALEKAVDEAQANHAAAVSDILPRADLRYSNLYNNTGGSVYGGGAVTTDQLLTLRVTVPIFNSEGQGYAAFRERYRVAESRYTLADQKLAVEQKVRDALSEAAAGVDRSAALSSAVTQSARHLAALRDRFRTGGVTVFEILERERDHSRVQREHLRARYNYLISIAQLKFATGLISREDVEYVDSLADTKQAPIVETAPR